MTPRKPPILVTGASGFIGRHVVASALTAGHEVRTLTRRDWLDGPAVPRQHRFLGSLPFDLPEAAFEGVDTVVHLAALTTSDDPQVAHAINVEGSRNILRRAEAHGVRKIVFISSQSARPDGLSAYARTKAQAEELLLGSSVATTVLRPGLVYGPGERGLFARMRGVVLKLPVLPVLGSGTVQPIHVDDLAKAIALGMETEHDGRIYHLGEAEPMPLGAFLQAIARAETGRSKPVARVPVGPLIPVVQGFETLGLKLPVTSANLKGAKTVEHMETADDLTALGLQLRSLDDGLRSVKEGTFFVEAKAQTLRVALVGAGKMGMVHAITADRQPGMRLTALVDRSPKPIAMLTGMGVRAKGFSSLAEAREAGKPDLAIIATPPPTHLPIAKECAEHGIHMLVEKPIAPSAEALQEFRRALADAGIVVGYLAPSYPQFETALERLKAGEFGTPQSFEAFCLLGTSENSSGWEIKPEISGGGVLMNVGSHVVSMILAAFGTPESVRGERLKRYGNAVEDCLTATFDYPEVRGVLYASWTLPAYPNPENRLVIHTDEGQLYCTNNVAFFRRNDGDVPWVDHQVAHRESFNLAPDFSGGGVTAELQQLRRLAQDGTAPTMDLEGGVAVEEVLHDIYAKSPFQAEAFSSIPTPGIDPVAEPSITGTHAVEPILTLDVRRFDPRQLQGDPTADVDPSTGWLTYAPASRHWTERGVPQASQTLVLPDFLRYGRMLGGGQMVDFLKTIGPGGTLSMGFQGPKSVLRKRGVTFWAAVECLVAADLAQVPRNFDGTLLLHHFVNDLAVALDLTNQLGDLLAQLANGRSNARVGVQTSILPDALSALIYARRPLASIHFLTSPDNAHLQRALDDARALEGFAQCRFVAELGAVPGALAAAARRSPEPWLNGAEALSVEPGGSELWETVRRKRFDALWRYAFPGIDAPRSAQ